MDTVVRAGSSNGSQALPHTCKTHVWDESCRRIGLKIQIERHEPKIGFLARSSSTRRRSNWGLSSMLGTYLMCKCPNKGQFQCGIFNLHCGVFVDVQVIVCVMLWCLELCCVISKIHLPVGSQRVWLMKQPLYFWTHDMLNDLMQIFLELVAQIFWWLKSDCLWYADQTELSVVFALANQNECM